MDYITTKKGKQELKKMHNHLESVGFQPETLGLLNDKEIAKLAEEYGYMARN